MKAILTGEDGSLRWGQAPDPIPREDEALLEIHAAGVNRADLLQRAGQYPPPQGWPEWLGLEAAGVIRALGEKAQAEGRWHVGDPACALLGGGGYAEYAAAPSGLLMPIPRGLSMAEAAALPEAFGASWLFLRVEGQVKPGETVLVTGANSGLASVTIPMARAMGARVIASVRSEEKARAIAHLGAERVIVTERESLPAALERELAAGRGVDVAVDCLGGDTVGKCLPYMNRGGRWIMIATLAGDGTQVDLRQLYARGARLIGATLRSRSTREKADMLMDMTREMWPRVENGQVRPTLYRTLPIQQAEEAHRIMAEGGNVGKLVLTLR